MHYKNRIEAATKLLPFLNKYKEDDCVVLAIPRGGVPIACLIARHFRFPLELLMTKKIGHPSNPEFAIGAVGPDDYIVDGASDVSQAFIDEQVLIIRKNLSERLKRFTGNHVPVDFKNKTLIIIDDGIATGNTMLCSVRMLRKHNPAKIVIAVPVSSQDAAQRLRDEADDFICPYLPDAFLGVGSHYLDFSQVSDQEVIRLLKEHKS